METLTMTEKAKARRYSLIVKYTPAGGEEKDITADITPYILSLDYTDNLSDTADDINLTLEDRDGLWRGGWYPEGEGNMLDITALYTNRILNSDGVQTLHIGKFEIDEISLTGSPATVQIKGISVIGNGSLRSVRNNKTWEKITIKDIAADICKNNELTLFWDCDDNPTLEHVEQADESDLAFLQKICHDKGFSLKVETERIIIFDDEKYERQEPNIVVFGPHQKDVDITGIPLPLRWLTSYSFSSKTRDTYDSCVVTYQSGEKKKVLTGTYTKKGKARTKTVAVKKKMRVGKEKENGRVLHIRKQVKNAAEAEHLAKKKLREANKDAVTGNFATIGNPNFAAGVTCEMRGFGHFDGRYLITKVSHKFSSSGTTTDVEIRKCLEGY